MHLYNDKIITHINSYIKKNKIVKLLCIYIYTVTIKKNATTHFLILKAYNSLTTYARTIILYLF